MKVLTGHNSPDTAYVVEDYPYGFKLRCKIRYWIETTKQGQRLCTQTTNPKKSVESWNNPKKSTYSDLKIMYLDSNNHVKTDSLRIDFEAYRIAEFVNDYKSALTDEYSQNVIRKAKLLHKTRTEMKKLALEATNGASDNIYDVPREKQAYVLAQARANALND